MKLSQLKMLAAVVDSGSFSAAAAQLSCTQSRISHAIGGLEQELGVRLLDRSHAGSVLTDAGHRVMEKARQMLHLEASLLDTARDCGALAAHVRIACFRSVGTHLLPHALEALAHAYPGIRIDIDDSCEEREDVTRAVREGRADLGIAHLPAADDLVARPYLHDAYVLVVPASLRIDAPVQWRQLDALPFIALACSGAASILARCREAGFSAEPSRTLANDTSIAALVGRGMGYSILPRLATFPAPDDVRIIDLPLQARRRFAVVGTPATMRLPAIQVVTRFLRDQGILGKTKAYRAGIISFD
ncbi:MAG TPA: LysR family transcriptional regulator [Telluria sp.]